MIDLFVQLTPGYTHEQVEQMPHWKFLHYLQKRLARGVPMPTGGLF